MLSGFFRDLPGSIEEQARELLHELRQNIRWSQDIIVIFLEFHKQRAGRKVLDAGTINNCVKSINLFL